MSYYIQDNKKLTKLTFKKLLTNVIHQVKSMAMFS